ncbi:MAG: 2-hydroxy-7-methoxy-5-methyl-1-naphthoate--CoA ligase [Alphaproteobacteria bacterium MarineAlpha11_Bin1]|mgnify:CR=1 FL=1|nr:MAG: 2-hydroxy-7-methoxy-5-methyl-1-naphthoate--CoA ligase [Alphaproteobacteria bacterium MarineAlpha11_Bin1]|tara:strand:+ start:7969 stop:9960 length:1992 start_codon:yes stop_codon:yes gene_type:complete
MTRGLKRSQIGMSEEMIQTYGESIFEMSHNIQVRRGDAVRKLDWKQIESTRADRGMSDAELARQLGLTHDQVTYIRTIMERRKFKRHNYHRLYDLGGGRRFRSERFVPHSERFEYRPEALDLRKALDFDPRIASKHLRLGNWNGDTVANWVQKWATEKPEANAVIDSSGETTFKQIYEDALRLANSLLELGIRKGDVVAIQLPNTTEFMTVYFAVCMMGGVLSTMHMPYRSGELKPLLTHGSARAIVCNSRTNYYDAPSEMLGLCDRVDTLDHVIVASESAPAGTLSLHRLIREGTKDQIENPPVASDPAILCFTSGTSSAPKAVVHSYQTMLANNRIAAPIYNMTNDDIVLGGPPFTHAFGICVMNLTLMVGAASLMMPAFSPKSLIELIETSKPTVIFVAPAHVAACLKEGSLKSGNLSSVRIATISGAACPPNIAYALENAMPRGSVGQMWGMTECFMGLHTPFDAPANVRCESLGDVTPTFEVRIISENGSAIADNIEGALEIRGCSVVARYFNNEESNRTAFTGDGWFRTGDLATRGLDGLLRITGREKDLINRGGIKINPTDIEAVIDTHPSVVMSAITPLPDEVLGERLCLYVQLKPNEALSLEQICEWLSENQIAKMRWPERLEIVTQMPMTPTKKIIKGALITGQVDLKNNANK